MIQSTAKGRVGKSPLLLASMIRRALFRPPLLLSIAWVSATCQYFYTDLSAISVTFRNSALLRPPPPPLNSLGGCNGL